MAVLIETENINIGVGKDVEISFKESFPYQSEMNVFVNGVQKTNGISYNMYDSGTAKYMVYSFTISFSESGTYDVYVTYDNRIFGLQTSNTLTFTVKDKTNIILNHKEVQSIQLTNGGIIYQRPIFNQIGSFTVSSSKDIISFVDEESTTITATVLDNNDNPISHEFILFEVDSGEYIDTFTDENGEASIIYEAKGWGDIKITVFCRNLTEIYNITDGLGYFTKDNNPFSEVTVSGDYYTVSQNTAIISLPTPIQLPSEFEISYTGYISGSGSRWNLLMVGEEANCRQYNLGMLNKGSFLRKGREGCSFDYLITNTNKYSSDTDISFVYRYQNNTHTLIVDGVTYTSDNADFNPLYFFGIGIGNSARMKNILIKPLSSIEVSATKDILSYADNDYTTLTATLSPIMSGKSVKIYKDDVLINIKQIDNLGQVSYVYESQGVGDVEFRFECGTLTETLTIRDFTYIVDTMEKLTTALTNATTDNSIYLKDGTYSLPSNYTVSGIKLIGESTNAKIVSSNGQINFTDSIIDTIGIETANVNRPAIYVTGTTTVKNCDCVSNVKPWDATVIKVNLNNPNGLITIHDCYFHGDARSSGYGHSCSAITGEGSVAYNVIIHHNTFNHPCNSGQLHGSNKGKAVCFYNGNSTTGTLNNVHLYCNEYLGCGDTNIRVSEETCPDD